MCTVPVRQTNLEGCVNRRLLCLLALVGVSALSACAHIGSTGRHVTQGPATTVLSENIYTSCLEQHPNLRKTAVGQITATDGTVITVGSGRQSTGRARESRNCRSSRAAEAAKSAGEGGA